MLLLVFQTLEMLTVSEEILLTLAVKVVLFLLCLFFYHCFFLPLFPVEPGPTSLKRALWPIATHEGLTGLSKANHAISQ